MSSLGLKTRQARTIHGEIRFWREVFQCRACRKSFASLDIELGLPKGGNLDGRVIERMALAGRFLRNGPARRTAWRGRGWRAGFRFGSKVCWGSRLDSDLDSGRCGVSFPVRRTGAGRRRRREGTCARAQRGDQAVWRMDRMRSPCFASIQARAVARVAMRVSAMRVCIRARLLTMACSKPWTLSTRLKKRSTLVRFL